MVDVETILREAQFSVSAGILRNARDMFYEATGMSTSWILSHGSRFKDQESFAIYGELLAGLSVDLPSLLGIRSRERYDAMLARFIDGGLSNATASAIVASEYVYPLLEIIELAIPQKDLFGGLDKCLDFAGRAYFLVYEELCIGQLLTSIAALPLTQQWTLVDRFVMMRRVYTALSPIVAGAVIEGGEVISGGYERFDEWMVEFLTPGRGESVVLRQALAMRDGEDVTFDRIVVATSLLRRVAASSGRL
jgi:NAD-specific glutamate dehydrogenase